MNNNLCNACLQASLVMWTDLSNSFEEGWAQYQGYFCLQKCINSVIVRRSPRRLVRGKNIFLKEHGLNGLNGINRLMSLSNHLLFLAEHYRLRGTSTGTTGPCIAVQTRGTPFVSPLCFVMFFLSTIFMTNP